MPEVVPPRIDTAPNPIPIGSIANGLQAPMPHVATPITYSDSGDLHEWIEGEPGADGLEPAQGQPFPCFLFLPSGGGAADTTYRLRTVQTPQMLFQPMRGDGSIIALEPESELLISAPELSPWTGAPVARWMLNGRPLPFGPPGQVIGVLATLRQVVD